MSDFPEMIRPGRFFRELAPTGLSFLCLFLLAALLYATCTQCIYPDQFAVKCDCDM